MRYLHCFTEWPSLLEIAYVITSKKKKTPHHQDASVYTATPPPFAESQRMAQAIGRANPEVETANINSTANRERRDRMALQRVERRGSMRTLGRNGRHGRLPMAGSPCSYTNESSERKFKATVAAEWDRTGKSNNTRTESGIASYSKQHRKQVRSDGKRQREKGEGKSYWICMTDGLTLFREDLLCF